MTERQAGSVSSDAKHAVGQIVTDLTGRKGLRHVWEEADGEDVSEIKATWQACVERDMRKVQQRERSRAKRLVLDAMAELGCDNPCPKHGEECPLADVAHLIEYPQDGPDAE